MALVIRFAKIGRRGERKYRIVVKEKRSKRDGKAIDSIGYFEKKMGGAVIKKVNKDKLAYWRSHGAQVTPAVQKILISTES